MTLVGLEESNSFININKQQHLVSMMLGVQHQQHYHHPGSPPIHHVLTTSTSPVAHRSNVIVTAPNNNNIENKMNNMQQVQRQQPGGKSQQKRKMYTQTTAFPGSHKTASVEKRNARERNRVKQVNNGYAILRQHIPQALAQALGAGNASPSGSRGGSKKMSKVETLRMAVEYIRSLQDMLKDSDSEAQSSTCSSAGSPSPSMNQSFGSASIASDLDHHHHHHHQPAEIKFELKSESSDDDVQDLGAHHQYQHHIPQQHNRQSPVYIPAPCSEASSSPTPSFVSETSSAGGSQGYGTSFNNTFYSTHTESYENYEPMSPEDEELLDYITLWQTGQ